MTDKKISFQEFKAWLQGVEEMQDEGWSPTPVQWQKIKEKLGQIDLSAQLVAPRPANVEYRPTFVPPPESRLEQEVPFTPPPSVMQPPVSRLSTPTNIPETADHEQFVSRAVPRDSKGGGAYTTPFR